MHIENLEMKTQGDRVTLTFDCRTMMASRKVNLHLTMDDDSLPGGEIAERGEWRTLSNRETLALLKEVRAYLKRDGKTTAIIGFALVIALAVLLCLGFVIGPSLMWEPSLI